MSLTWHKNMGFTLVELMITIAIVGIIVGFGIPGFQEMIRKNRASSTANELISTLNLARSEAIKRGQIVTVCKSANVTDATPSCSADANWNQGWLIFVDINGNGAIDGNDTRLKIGQPSAKGLSINETNDDAFLSFKSNGLSNTGTTSLEICVGTIKRTIDMSNTGRVRIDNGTCL